MLQHYFSKKNAKLRIQEGSRAYISQNGNWTREGFIYVPKKGIFLTKNSPIIDNAREATKCHRNGNEFYLNKEQVEEALENSVEIKNQNIPPNKLGENEITVFAFGDIAKDYGLFLKDYGIKKMSIYLINIEEKPFARQLWFRGLGGGSELSGCGNLRSDLGARGYVITPKASQKILREIYTTKNKLEKP